jgi:hypothetical protein
LVYKPVFQNTKAVMETQQPAREEIRDRKQKDPSDFALGKHKRNPRKKKNEGLRVGIIPL